MKANQPHESVSQQEVAKAFAHDQMLIRAAYKAQRVIHQGKPGFLQVVNVDAGGSGIETIVYLKGSSTPIPASEITLAPEIK